MNDTSVKKSNKIFYDNNFVRYTLVKSNPGTKVFNWLFIPGGPGIDSNYLLSLINELDVPGNFWLIDLPYNGSNIPDNCDVNTIFDKWENYFLSTIQKFDNPIIVGHSFGGYYPLFFPELEKILKGFLILNSVPTVPSSSTINPEQISLPSKVEFIDAFMKGPSIESAMAVYLASAPYFFPATSFAKGIALLKKLTFTYQAIHWWHMIGAKKYSTIKWIPQQVPTLIVGGSYDFLTPITIFQQDERFKRDNIKIVEIRDAGHFPWVEQMPSVQSCFNSFVESQLA